MKQWIRNCEGMSRRDGLKLGLGGLVAGGLHLQGIVIIISFCIILHLVSQLYSQKVLQANDEDYA